VEMMLQQMTWNWRKNPLTIKANRSQVSIGNIVRVKIFAKEQIKANDIL